MTSVAARAADISVVIPTYNRAELLQQTLSSIESQTAPPAEIVVVDDGSTDGTRELLADTPVTVIANDDGGWGPSRARNAGLERVSTEYVAFADSDDLLLPGALESLRAAARARPDAPFAYGCALAVMAVDGVWTHQGVIAATREELRHPLASLFARNSVPSSGVLARTDAVRSVGGYDPDVEWAEDHHLWVRLAQRAPPVYVPQLVCAYRRHAGNRYTPAGTSAEAAPLLALAESDQRLRDHIPDRVGVSLCEVVAGSLAARRVAGLALAARTLLAQRSGRRRALRRALAHARLRRASGRLGDAVWSERHDVRDWLARF